MSDKWDERFVEATRLVAKWSSCKRRQVGAIIVKDKRIVATGYNGAPLGMQTCVESDECLRDIRKIESGKNQEVCFAVHAEQNAIVQAAKLGISIEGTTLYCTYKPCSICAKMIVNAGIKEVVYENDYDDDLTDGIFGHVVSCRKYLDYPTRVTNELDNRYDMMRCFLNYAGMNGKEVADTVKEIGFFDAPASTKYHLAYAGGLFDHSFNVAKTLLKFTNDNNLIWQKKRSPILVGLLHDLCKSDQYIATGTSFIFNKSSDTRHGIKSAEIAKILVPDLTEEEFMCIQYHMGAFTDKSEWNNYGLAVEKYPNVLWTHQADMYSSRIIESDK